ncbi:MAG: molybdate ABC transporter permease subunit [Coriobacteriia bacterium]|nr:molybdate ABC transporter permease subunit [Coriobacteriia bacterium]
MDEIGKDGALSTISQLGERASRAVRLLLALALALCVAAPQLLAPAHAFAAPADDAPKSAVDESTNLGVSEFERLQIGSSKTYEGKDYGYAFPLGKEKGESVTALVTPDCVLVYVAPEVASRAGFDPKDQSHTAALEAMMEQLDAGISRGGKTLDSLELPYVYVDQKECVRGDFTYRFAQEIEPDYFYVTCVAKGDQENKAAARFCDLFTLKTAAETEVVGEKTWFEKVCDFLDPEHLDYRPLWVSLKTAGVAMIFIFSLGLIAAWRSMHVKSRWKSILDSIFTIPMVLPPTVCGFLLLLLFGQSTAVGRWLIDHGIELVFSWPAAVIAAVVVGFPLMYRTALGAFEALDANMLDAARTLGWSETRIFVRLMMPNAWPSIAAGTVLAFARAMGEFGATLFVAGNYAGVTQTMPLAIFYSWMGGSTDVAIFWVIVVIFISFLVILFINLYSAHVQNYRRSPAQGKSMRKNKNLPPKDADGGNGEGAAGFSSPEGETDGEGSRA